MIDPKAILSGNVRVLGPGYAKGRIWEARIAREADDRYELKDGDVLVLLDGDVDLRPTIERSVAVLVEQKDRESRVVRDCRALNVPCIVGIEGLLDWVNRNDYLEINTRKNTIKKFNVGPFGSYSTYKKRTPVNKVETPASNPTNKKRTLADIIFGRNL